MEQREGWEDTWIHPSASMLLVVISFGLPMLAAVSGKLCCTLGSPKLGIKLGFFGLRNAGLVPWGSSPLLPCSGGLCSSCIPSLPGPMVSVLGGWFGGSRVLPLLNVSLGLSQAHGCSSCPCLTPVSLMVLGHMCCLADMGKFLPKG